MGWRLLFSLILIKSYSFSKQEKLKSNNRLISYWVLNFLVNPIFWKKISLKISLSFIFENVVLNMNKISDNVYSSTRYFKNNQNLLWFFLWKIHIYRIIRKPQEFDKICQKKLNNLNLIAHPE